MVKYISIKALSFKTCNVVFPWDQRELLLLRVPNLLVGMFYHVKNEGCLLEFFIMRLFNRTLSMYVNLKSTHYKMHQEILYVKNKIFVFAGPRRGSWSYNCFHVKLLMLLKACTTFVMEAKAYRAGPESCIVTLLTKFIQRQIPFAN